MITKIREIKEYYSIGKESQEYLFFVNIDDSTRSSEKFKSQLRRLKGYLKIIVKDSGIEGTFTTYTIRHSWETIAKYMENSTEIISAGLGHYSPRTTEIHPKSFDNKVLDEANRLIVS